MEVEFNEHYLKSERYSFLARAVETLINNLGSVQYKIDARTETVMENGIMNTYVILAAKELKTISGNS